MKRFMQMTPSSVASTWRKKGDVTAKDILDGAELEDPLAAATVEYCMEFLGQTIATIGQIIDPDIFIIGGGVSQAGEFLLEIIDRYYQKYSVFSKERVDIVLAQLGNDAGIYGAAKLLLDNCKS